MKSEGKIASRRCKLISIGHHPAKKENISRYTRDASVRDEFETYSFFFLPFHWVLKKWRNKLLYLVLGVKKVSISRRD